MSRRWANSPPRRLLAVCGIVALLAAQAVAQPTDYVRCDIAAGGSLVAIAGGDFDRDGSEDFAAVDSSGNRIVIFIGDRAAFSRGDCEAATQQKESAVGTAPGALAVADVDGNATQDIVVSEVEGVLILSGDGEGNFTAQTTLSAGVDPRGVTVADLDPDGLQDLAVADGAGNSIQLLFGKSGGGFEPAVAVPVGQAVIAVSSDDLNLDGRPDLVALSSQNTVVVALQSGSTARSFSVTQVLGVGVAPQAMALELFDLGAVPDIAVASRGDGELTLFTGQLSGTSVVYSQEGPAVATSLALTGLAADDLDGDGTVDAALVGDDQNNSGRALALPGDGDGGFGESQDFSIGTGPTSVALADVDGDGLPDVLSTTASGVTVLLSSNPAPTPTRTPTVTLSPTVTATPTPTPGFGCCSVHPEPGCEVSDCQDCVCKGDVFCCEPAGTWDQRCVDRALGTCAADCACPSPTTRPTNTVSVTPTLTPTPTGTPSYTPTSTFTVTGTLPRTATPTFTITGTRPPTATYTATPTVTPTPTPTTTASRTPTPSNTPTETATFPGGFDLQGGCALDPHRTSGWDALLPLLLPLLLLVSRRR